MIIKIEDAPHIKNIKIDINFGEDEEPVIEINKTSENTKLSKTSKPIKKKSKKEDIPLDISGLNTTDTPINTEVVKKPEIPDVKRDVKVSEDMTNAEF